MYFCIRDDDTSFFTRPEDLERAYGEISRFGPVSLAIVPFGRAGTSQSVPEEFRNRWTVHPLHRNRPLVAYLRQEIQARRFEAMLHGYYHDEPDGTPEFVGSHDLERRLVDGRKYLEDLLHTRIAVFVPPHNQIGSRGLRAIEKAGLHLGGVAGIRSGWPLAASRTWRTWARLKRWRRRGGVGIPWALNIGRHVEIAGTAITPASRYSRSEAVFDAALSADGVFCAATHYWELEAGSRHLGELPVGEQLHRLIERALRDPRVVWRSLGAIATEAKAA